MKLLGENAIEKISLKKNRAEITFHTAKSFKESLLIDGVPMKNGSKISVKPLIATGEMEKVSE
jgi:hypothetical protein